MKKDFDDYLVQRYPAIFAERQGDKLETAMCRGLRKREACMAAAGERAFGRIADILLSLDDPFARA